VQQHSFGYVEDINDLTKTPGKGEAPRFDACYVVLYMQAWWCVLKVRCCYVAPAYIAAGTSSGGECFSPEL
jgi:hypothetical protein